MDISDDEVRNSLLRAGIGARYANKDVSISQFGKTGELIATDIKEGVLKQAVESGKGLFFYGDDALLLEAVTHLFARWLVLGLSKSVVVYSIPEVIDILDGHGDDPLLFDSDCVVIEGFHSSKYVNGLTDSQRYRLEWHLRRSLLNGAILILSSEQSIKDSDNWWGPHLLQILKDRTIEKKVQ